MCPWGKCPGGTCLGGFCPVTLKVIVLCLPTDITEMIVYTREQHKHILLDVRSAKHRYFVSMFLIFFL